MVVFGHSMQFSEVLCNGYDFKRRAFNYFAPTHLMVMVFFMLSGYVIGINYNHKNTFSIIDYLKKRLIRLYPIYLIAIGITIFFFPQSIKSVIGHLFFLQIAVVDFFKENVALWSLNYEMLYYLLAIPIIMFRIKALHVISVILLIK